MLELKNLKTSYGQSQVLFGVDLQVNEREVVTLLGRNGMGKTTTINSIMGMVRARSGEISLKAIKYVNGLHTGLLNLEWDWYQKGAKFFPI